MGKHLAEFRRASEDFKRTWEREVALEDLQSDPARVQASPAKENSILNPLVVEPPANQIVSRAGGISDASLPSETASSETATTTNEAITPEAPRKQDWL